MEASSPSQAAAAAPAQELWLQTARKDGREVATLRCLWDGAAYVIQSEVYPVSGLRVEPLRPGPYRFASQEEASAFVQEAMLALTYLGCEVV